MTAWTSVSAEKARKHPLYGRKGTSLLLIMYLIAAIVTYFALIAVFTHANQSPKGSGFAILLLLFILYRLIRKRPCKSLIQILAIILFPITAVVCLLYAVIPDPNIRPILFDAAGTSVLFSLFIALPMLAYANTSRRFRVTFENEIRSDDPFLSQDAKQAHTSKSNETSNAGFAGPKTEARSIRCPKCNSINRIAVYSLSKRPICGICREPLAEPFWLKALRFCYLNPFAIMASALGGALLGFFFLDRYIPGYGFVWNLINGRVFGLGYRYVLGLSTVVFLYGGFIYLKRP